MHVLLVGVEHLMTGLQLATENHSQLTFERESASIVRVMADSPITAYWPVKQSTTTSSETEAKPEKYSTGEVECAVKVCEAMQVADRTPDRGDDVLPWPVIKAMRRKFGREANDYMRPYKLYSYGSYWGFTHAGMFHGVEPDGYIHT